MRTLGQLLGSTARTEVLRVLHNEPEPVGLRHVARIANLHPRSVQLALAGLVDESLVTCDRATARPLYQLHRPHPDVPVLDAVFRAATQTEIQRRSATLQTRARTILPFIEEATQMLATMRERQRVT